MRGIPSDPKKALERNKKISNALKGRVPPLSAFKKGHKINVGRKRPEWVRRKLSEAKKGKKNPNWNGGISKDKSYWSKIEYARKKNAEGRFTTEEWELLKKAYGNKCAKCKNKEWKEPLTVDHIIPLSKGGSNYISNIQPLCRSCNSSKRDKIEEYDGNTRSLIIGAGEVGLSLFQFFKNYYQVSIIDEYSECFEKNIAYLHITFPYSKNFIKEVKKYQKKYKPTHTIIHSTCPPGTSRKCNATFSMIVGIHPHLEKSIKTFTKFLAGEEASLVANYFRKAGMKVYLYDKQEALEYAKVSQTTFYALMIEYVKNLKRICDKENLNFAEVYTLPSQDYNRGYEILGYPEFKMPMLTPILTKQGGHCTIANCDFWNTPFTKLIKELNLYD